MKINESMILPITSGRLDIDTTAGSIIIYMVSGHAGDVLEIAKISNDENVVSLFSETTYINDAEIIIFGVPKHLKNIKKGKIRNIKIRCDGKHWVII